MAEITVYGADWCSMTKRALTHLDDLGIDYKYVDIDADAQAAKWVASHNGGKEKKPTVDIGGEILSEPSNHALDEALRAKGLLH